MGRNHRNQFFYVLFSYVQEETLREKVFVQLYNYFLIIRLDWKAALQTTCVYEDTSRNKETA